MKAVKIEFSFDDTKLEAIHLFLKEKDSTLSEELEHFMDALYKKYVPQQVREYIEKRETDVVSAAPTMKSPARRKASGTAALVCDASLEGAGTRPAEESPT
jgi:hypothetical protein